MPDEEVVKWLNGLLAAHNTSEFPLILGTTEQANDLLEVVGEWKGYKNGNIPGMIYDDMLSYYNEGLPGNIITGRAEEARDKTPVGVVTHPAPLDITSWLYWTPLVAQGIEQSYSAIKNNLKNEDIDKFKNEISIADVMGKVAYYEKTPEEKHKDFKISYYQTDENDDPKLIGYMKANQPVPISEWPRGFGPFQNEGNTHGPSSGALVSELIRTYDPMVKEGRNT